MYKMIIFLAITPLFLMSNEKEILNAAINIQKELTPSSFAKEQKKFLRYEKRLNKLETYEKTAYKKNSNSRFEILNSIYDIQKESQSLIVSQYMIDKTLQYVSIKDSIKFMKLIKPSMEILYKKRLCDGILFMGEYKSSVEGDKIGAFEVYRSGIKTCKIKWKNFDIQSRFNKLNYRLGKVRGQ